MESQVSDEDLYVRARRGDIGPVDELYSRHSGRLFRFLRLQLPTAADAEDVMHEAFLATLESREVVFEQAGRFPSWLYRIARNRVLNRFRSRGRGDGALRKMMATGEEHAPAADDRMAQEQLL